MKLLLKRKYFGDNYTTGDLYVDGKFFCNTIEDKVRQLPKTCPDTPKGISCKCKEKIYAETAIPVGTYKITMKLSSRFGVVLPYLHDVPHFIGVLIHSGNTEKDSSGCIIAGDNTSVGKVANSRATCDKLNRLLANEKEITIEII